MAYDGTLKLDADTGNIKDLAKEMESVKRLSTEAGTSIDQATEATTRLGQAAGGSTILVEGLSTAVAELAKPETKQSVDALASGLSVLGSGGAKVAAQGIALLTASLLPLGTSATILAPALTAMAISFQTFSGIAAAAKSIDAMNKSIKAMEELKKAATVAHLAENGALSLSQIAYAFLTGQITLAAAAHAVLNAVMAVMPFVAVIAGVAALAAGITALVVWTKKESEADQQLRKDKEAVAEANKALIDSTRESAKAYEDAIGGINTESEAIKSLAERLYEVQAAEGQTADGKAKMQAIVDQLNTALPELNLAIDEETGLLNQNEEAINRIIDARQEELRLQATKERALELAKELVDIETQRALVEEKIAALDDADSSKVKNELLAEYNDELETLNEQYDDTAAALDIVTESQMEHQKALEETGLSEAQLALAEYEAQVESLSEAWGVSGEKIKESVEASGMSIEEFADTVSGHTGAITNSFKEIPESFDQSLDDLMEIQRTNIERYADFQRNIVELSDKLSEGALEELAALGPGANSILEELIAGGEEKWNEYNNLYAEKTSLAVDTAAGTLRDGDMPGAAEELLDNTGEAITENTSIEDAVGEKPSNAKEAFDEGIENAAFSASGDLLDEKISEGIGHSDHSENAIADSTKELKVHTEDEIKHNDFDETGALIIEEQSAGIDDNLTAEESARRAVEDVYYAAWDEVNALSFWRIGDSIIQGLTEGIRNGIPIIAAAAREAARAAYEAARSELDIHSPSRKFEYLAKMSVQGYEEGIKSGESTWEKALAQSVNGALSTVDSRQFRLASGHAASVAAHTAGMGSSSDIVIEKVVVEGAPINSSLDAEKIGRRIGDQAARQIRLRGGLSPA